MCQRPSSIGAAVSRRSRSVALTVLLALPGYDARADDEFVDDDASAGVSDMEQAQARLDEAEQRARGGEHDAAIAAYKAGLEALPAGDGYARARARALLGIVDSQRAAFQRDGELDRLHEAARMLDQYIGALEIFDDEGRLEAEQRRVQLQREIAVIEAERAREASAQAVARKRLEAAKERQRATILTFSGVGAVVLGAGGFGLMGWGLVRGQAIEIELNELTNPTVRPTVWICADWDAACRGERIEQNAALLRSGDVANATVIVGAVTGAALVATGVALLALGSRARGRSRALDRAAERLELQPLPTLTSGGAGLVLLGRF